MICVGRMHRTPEELNMHVEQCRKVSLICRRLGGQLPIRQNSVNDEDETVDVEGDSELEEWAEHQRRTSTSVSTAASGNTIGSSTGRVTDNDNDNDDVIVDGDEPEECSFGPSQYTDSDVVIKTTQDKTSKKEGVQSQVATVNSSGDVQVTMDVIVESDSNVSTSDAEPTSRTQMLEELREQNSTADGGEFGGDGYQHRNRRLQVFDMFGEICAIVSSIIADYASLFRSTTRNRLFLPCVGMYTARTAGCMP
jgi:hypothetical protein